MAPPSNTSPFFMFIPFPSNLSIPYVEEEYRHGKDLRKIFMEIKGKGFPGSLTPFYDHYGYREYFTAVCAACGGEAKVPFEPKSDRPVYCSECFAKMRENG